MLHIEHVEDGLRLYIRLPMPYLVADKLGSAPAGELPDPAPFTTNSFENDVVVHHVDVTAVLENPEGLAEFVSVGHMLFVDGAVLTPEFRKLLIHAVGSQPGFATLSEAKAAMAGELTDPTNKSTYVGDTIVDVELFFPSSQAVSSYSISSSLNPGLPGQENTANLILDYANDDPKVFRSRGLMDEPVTISQSSFTAAITFVWEGVRHILEGIDHVLFVICLVISATTLSSLLWRVTGFTVGHSVTLTIGFFGFVPSAAWFVPAVETGIAMSIIYAALLAIWPRFAGNGGNGKMLVVTAAIGLLHGLGFSFVLQKILQVDAPNIWQSLLAFNLGVEIGQVAIVLVVWPALVALKKINVPTWRVTRLALAGGCTVIACVWTVERLGQLTAAL
ncbi:HupE/UreJ family protein [Roseibium sp.]|uniref:HupE/UreJ family protein n=1 Tax=Roseibium sp. TaxID=1936156 RepID=UPI003BA8F838